MHHNYNGDRQCRDDCWQRETSTDNYAQWKEEQHTRRSRYGTTDDTIRDRVEWDR